jgi:hypothetical protein
MEDPDQLAPGAEGADNLGRRRQQRHHRQRPPLESGLGPRETLARQPPPAGTRKGLGPAGEDGGETVRALLDKAGRFPVLIQHLKVLGLDPADGRTSRRADGMSWAHRRGPGHPEHSIGTVSQGWHVLELLGTDLVAHRHPRWDRGSILPTAPHVQLRLQVLGGAGRGSGREISFRAVRSGGAAPPGLIRRLRSVAAALAFACCRGPPNADVQVVDPAKEPSRSLEGCAIRWPGRSCRPTRPGGGGGWATPND